MNTNLYTKRLFIRKIHSNDAPSLFSIWSDPIVTEYMSMRPFQYVAQVEEFITFLNHPTVNKRVMLFAIMLKETNRFIGTCGFNDIDLENSRAEIAYDLGKEFWGNAYAFEAVQTIIENGFNELDLNRIEAKVDPRNKRSIHLLEKLHFSFEGTLRQYEKSNGSYIDIHLYSKLKNES